MKKTVYSFLLFLVFIDNTLAEYNHDFLYDGPYLSGYFYNDLNDDYDQGFPLYVFHKKDSFFCDYAQIQLNKNGLYLGYFNQKDNLGKWKNLIKGSSKNIRCDKGFSHTIYSANYMNWNYNKSNNNI